MTSKLNVVNFNRDSNGAVTVQIDGESSFEMPALNASSEIIDTVSGQVKVASATPIQLTVTDDAAPPGNCTLTGVSGKVAIALGASAVVITRTGVTTATKCFAQKLSLDATLTDYRVVCTANTITITGNANATADCYFDFVIFQPVA